MKTRIALTITLLLTLFAYAGEGRAKPTFPCSADDPMFCDEGWIEQGPSPALCDGTPGYTCFYCEETGVVIECADRMQDKCQVIEVIP
jgi:hypothetical protein